MDRRKFLQQTGTLLAGAALAPYAIPDGAAQSKCLDVEWTHRFSPSTATGATAIPWSRADTRKGSTTQDLTASSSLTRMSGFPGTALTRRPTSSSPSTAAASSFPPEARGKHVFVDFEGVMTASTVWINGERLGEYKGGYTPFSFDLTPHIDFDGDNRACCRCRLDRAP